MDATDNELGEAQYYECCVVELYNQARPHASLGPGLPEPAALAVPQAVGHQLAHGHRVAAKPILGGLHDEYRLEAVAA